MKHDDLTGEQFGLVVGKRARPPLGQPPGEERRAALALMARYTTRAPKGVFIYRSHEEANEDQQRWLAEAVVAKHTHG